VLRLPGFLHRKNGTPHVVRIIANSGKRYTRAEIIAAFPALARKEREATSSREWHPQHDDDEQIRDAIFAINADDRMIWRDVGMALKDHYSDGGRALWDDWSRTSKKYDDKEQEKAWRSFRRQGITIATLFHHAKQAGWKDEAARNRRSNAPSEKGRSTTKSEKRLVVRDADRVEPEPVEWLWPGRIAIGKTTLVGGDPGLGKSQLSIFIAATVTVAGEWPCREGRPAAKRSVIMLSAEDGVADTIVPRLMAAGADRAKVKIVTAVHEADGTGRRIFNLTHDLDVLEKLIIEVGDVGLVIIDPVDAYIGGNVDSHKNAAVRAVLEPISELADRLDVAILALTHFSKQLGGKAIYRFIGSIAHIGSARIAFAVVADQEDKTRLLLLHAKNNLAPPQKGLAFRIQQHLVTDSCVIGSSIFFEAEYVTGISADEALNPETGETTTTELAGDFLRTVLAKGRVAVLDIEGEARQAGLLGETQRVSLSKPFRSACDDLHVAKTREGFGPGAVHYWSLPEAQPQDTPSIVAPAASIVASPNSRATMEDEGNHGSENTTVTSPNEAPQTPCLPSNTIVALQNGGATMEGDAASMENCGAEPPEIEKIQPNHGGNGSADDLPIPPFLLRAYAEEATDRSEPPGAMVINGFAVSATPEDRKPPLPGQLTARVWIKEIRPPMLGPPDDDLNDFTISGGPRWR
jgi:putative DNA primase/helicase